MSLAAPRRFGQPRHGALKGVAVQVGNAPGHDRVALVASCGGTPVSIAPIAPSSIASRTSGVQPSGKSALAA